MATWTRFYINSSNSEKTTNILKELSGITESSNGNIPADFHDSFLMDEKANPNYILFSEIQKNWITVLYNSDSKIESWAQRISEELNCIVIVTIGQNTVDYYYFSQFLNGEKKREIEVCYGDDIEPINFGAPYDFEEEEPGEKQEYDDEISYLFDFDSLERYSQNFGLEIQSDWDNITWTILKGVQSQKTTKDFIDQHLRGIKKPWWKFW
ncbi:hypothetical protein [Croceimicrobium hydrocarbonivorans]|uniref:Uncharacterized protein n=1 Tax=Croceimicrobium hydrocarbonivorans TaxID=2761580 RepID=A0A7H0VHA5_9FLAO|nr:hypothetical protein [Croceimicrobium hydrocarbonivorans]QNR25103.1 hypothetical protein H4K34_04500 [Croceimicrobium hydrocarbonivorans]